MDVASGIDVQQAFRRGVRGAQLAEQTANGLAEDTGTFAHGANEGVLMALPRMAGLADPYAAYETGRALRMIMQLFDRAGAPERIGRQFLDNLAGAVVIERMRGSARPWDAADTVDMFVELYSRVLGGDQVEVDQIRRAVMDFAVANTGDRPPPPVPWYRRPA